MIKLNSKLRTFFVMLIISFILIASLASAQGQQEIDVTVSVQISFGLPNPSWIISDTSEIIQLQEFLDDLPSANPVEFPPVGAFIIFSRKAPPEFPRRIDVYNRTIKVTKADKTTEFFQDTKSLTEFLVNRAIEHDIRVPGIIQGDLDGDGDVDQNDINILLRDRNKTAPQSVCGGYCDFDKDGKITALDSRKLTLLCTRPRCATK